MLWQKKLAVILVFCLLGAEGRKSSVGGSRGSSASRGQAPPPNFNSGGGGGGFQPQRPGGAPFQPAQGGFAPAGGHPGGFQPQPHPGSFGGARPAAGGFQPHPNYNGGRSSFQPGSASGPGSVSSGSTFKHALAGAAIGTVGGLLAFEAGKAILHSATTPFHNNGKDYYFAQEGLQNKPGQIRCSMPLNDLVKNIPAPTTAAPVEGENATIPSSNDVLSTLQFANGTRPHEIVWACKSGAEVCCGTDCCPAPPPPPPQNGNSGNSSSRSGGSSVAAIILGIVAVLLLICCCGCCIIYHFCRSVLDCIFPRKDDYQATDDQPPEFEYYYQDEPILENNGYQQHPTQSYPMQQYPNSYDQSGAYPTQPAYPPQPQAYQGYPPQPHVGYAPAHY